MLIKATLVCADERIERDEFQIGIEIIIRRMVLPSRNS